MDREEYELFERLPSGSSNWRGLVKGLESARVRLWLLADEIGRQCFATRSGSRQVVLSRTPWPGARRLFQVGYGDGLAGSARFLHSHGYDVTSACGNRVAQFVLCMHPPYDFFVIDYSGPERARLEMIDWLRKTYPNTQILLLKPPLANDYEQPTDSVPERGDDQSGLDAPPRERSRRLIELHQSEESLHG